MVSVPEPNVSMMLTCAIGLAVLFRSTRGRSDLNGEGIVVFVPPHLFSAWLKWRSLSFTNEAPGGADP